MAVAFTTPGCSDGVTNNSTPVDVVASPGSSVFRAVRFVNVYNADTVAQTVTFQIVSGSNTRIIEKVVSLAAGSTWRFGDDNEVIWLDAANKKLQIVLGGTVTTNQLQWIASFGDYA